MSIPRSAIASMARGFTDVFSVPALAASKRSPASVRSSPSAIWLRAELCVQRNRTRGRDTSGVLGGVEQPFDDHAVAPLPVELAVAAVHADDTEPAPLVQREARSVLREDPRHDLPEAALRVSAAERLERGAARPGAARGPRDVHRVLGHAGVGRTAAVGAGARP